VLNGDSMLRLKVDNELPDHVVSHSSVLHPTMTLLSLSKACNICMSFLPADNISINVVIKQHMSKPFLCWLGLPVPWTREHVPAGKSRNWYGTKLNY
jgi:hypothetical protein